MATESEHGPITSFLLRLGEDEELFRRWQRDKREALAGQGLTQEDEELLASGDFQQIRSKVEEEHTGKGPQPLMLFLMRA